MKNFTKKIFLFLLTSSFLCTIQAMRTTGQRQDKIKVKTDIIIKYGLIARFKEDPTIQDKIEPHNINIFREDLLSLIDTEDLVKQIAIRCICCCQKHIMHSSLRTN